MKRCDIFNATHLESRNDKGKVHRIASKWGIDGRHLAKPSDGGFGCVTESGERISMWDAFAYYQETPEAPVMSTWVVYDHPRDFPDKFVARRHDIYRGRTEPCASEEYFTRDSLQEVRDRLQELNPNLSCLNRFPDDDKNIVEVWL